MAAEMLSAAAPLPLRILVVEDDAHDAELLDGYLAEAVRDGAELLHARSLTEGLRLLEAHDVHLTLLDLDLPDSSGFQTLERMRAAAAGPVVVISGNGHPSLVQEVLKRRAYDVIPKNELDAATLRRILRLAGMHQEAGRALRSTEERFRTTFEHAAVGLAHTDIEGRILLANERLCEILGYAREELVGRNFRDLSHPEDREASAALRADLHRGETQKVSLRKRYLRKDGEIVWIQLTISLVRDDGGNPLYEIAAFADVSGLVRTELHLRASESRLRAIIGAEPECVKVLDGEGTLIDMNPAGLAMVEADSLEAVAGQCVYALVVPEHRAAFRALTERVSRGERGMLEFEVIGLKGTRRWLETHAVPLSDEASGKTLMLGITRDVSARKESELAERRIRRMYAALSATSEAIVGAADSQTLYRRVCELLVEHGGIKLAAVRLVDRATGWIEAVAIAGEPASYLAKARVSVDRSRPQAYGPAARTVLEGCTVVNNDYFAEPSLALWHAAAREVYRRHHERAAAPRRRGDRPHLAVRGGDRLVRPGAGGPGGAHGAERFLRAGQPGARSAAQGRRAGAARERGALPQPDRARLGLVLGAGRAIPLQGV